MIERSDRPSGKKLSLSWSAISLGLGICTLGLARHSIQFYKEIEHLNWMTENRIMVDPYPIWTQMHALFIVGFFLSIVGSLLRRRLTLIVSILGFMLVLLVYLWWYAYSYHDLKLIAESNYPISPASVAPRLLGLINASWLDIAILFAVVIVLAWQMKFLIGTFRHRDEPK